MIVKREARMQLRTSEDIVRARQTVREWCIAEKFNLVGQTKMVTAASELARNTVEYGGGGELQLEAMEDGARSGVRLTFSDKGPGIPNVELALTDGYTSGKGLGLGLSGAKRLCDQFSIKSVVGQGTDVTILRWS
ncbi:MAG TPA: anti-sigma regulatory factor [Burkholderiales bacterium]|nr:anti-sigma regulatory factor [Burkholderiales bacterium]